MSAAERAAVEKKQSREKDVVFRVTELKIDPDGSGGDVDLVKVQFMFRGAEVFIVTTGVNAEGLPVVCFDAGDTLWRAILKWCRKYEQGQLNWREDKGHKASTSK